MAVESKKEISVDNLVAVLNAFALPANACRLFVLKESASSLVLHCTISDRDSQVSYVLKKERLTEANLAQHIERVIFGDSLQSLLQSYLPRRLHTAESRPYFLARELDIHIQFTNLWTASVFIANNPVFDWLDNMPAWTDTQSEDAGRLLAQVHLKGFAAAGCSSEKGSEKTIVHGDYHPGNVLFQDEKAVAIIDIDYATIQNPLCDLAYALLMFAPTESFNNRAVNLLQGYKSAFADEKKNLPLNTPDEKDLRCLLDGEISVLNNFKNYLGEAAHLILPWLNSYKGTSAGFSEFEWSERKNRLMHFSNLCTDKK